MTDKRYHRNRWEKLVDERVETEIVTTTTRTADGSETTDTKEIIRQYVTFEAGYATCLMSYKGHLLKDDFSTFISSDGEEAVEVAMQYCKGYEIGPEDPLVIEVVTWTVRVECVLVSVDPTITPSQWDDGRRYDRTGKRLEESERQVVWSSRQLGEPVNVA